ncbi:cyclase family protein [Vandammella animalimorsus]|uniref:Cyclase n=1 Tax=Vandammella animalimorsus TaxID=2029117 RepID=A0A2A2ACA8_9BURK|nr:cyclase family protein [Vandammella animalimorsus]PAT35381.1 cyclase [Vandammella animalimorsus]
MKRWIQRPPGSNWGDFGPDDQLGRVNLIGPEQVRKGAQEIQAGLSFCLSMPLDFPGGSVLNPRRHPPQKGPTYRGETPYFNHLLRDDLDAAAIDGISDDQVLLSMQYSTQWDSLAHVGALFDADGDGVEELVYYNGYRAGEHIIGPEMSCANSASDRACAAHGQLSHAGALGVDAMAVKGMQGRGVLLDLVRVFGMELRHVGYDDLMYAIESTGVEIEAGDMLVLRTGYAELLLQMERQPDVTELHRHCAALNGRDERLLQWITDSQVAAIAADNYAVERTPALPPPVGQVKYPLFPLHQHCLFKLGLPLAELWYLRDLADWLYAHQRYRFFLTAPPLRLPGAVGSPVTPIATV